MEMYFTMNPTFHNSSSATDVDLTYVCKIDKDLKNVMRTFFIFTLLCALKRCHKMASLR